MSLARRCLLPMFLSITDVLQTVTKKPLRGLNCAKIVSSFCFPRGLDLIFLFGATSSILQWFHLLARNWPAVILWYPPSWPADHQAITKRYSNLFRVLWKFWSLSPSFYYLHSRLIRARILVDVHESMKKDEFTQSSIRCHPSDSPTRYVLSIAVSTLMLRSPSRISYRR